MFLLAHIKKKKKNGNVILKVAVDIVLRLDLQRK